MVVLLSREFPIPSTGRNLENSLTNIGWMRIILVQVDPKEQGAVKRADGVLRLCLFPPRSLTASRTVCSLGVHPTPGMNSHHT